MQVLKSMTDVTSRIMVDSVVARRSIHIGDLAFRSKAMENKIFEQSTLNPELFCGKSFDILHSSAESEICEGNATLERFKAEKWFNLQFYEKKERRVSLYFTAERTAMIFCNPLTTMQRLEWEKGEHKSSKFHLKAQLVTLANIVWGFAPRNKLDRLTRDSPRVAKISQSMLSDFYLPQGVDDVCLIILSCTSNFSAIWLQV
jgi:hypothetical protein